MLMPMIVSCPNCATRSQLEDAKVPARPFTVRCPECQHSINAQPAGEAADNGGLGVVSPAAAIKSNVASVTSHGETRTDMSSALSLCDARAEGHPNLPSPAPSMSDSGASSISESELGRMLTVFLQRALASAEDEKGAAPARGLLEMPRRALICAGQAYRDAITRALAGGNYEVIIASNATEAIEHLREKRPDVVILDPEFDSVEEGSAFIKHEINSLPAVGRRRLFTVLLTPAARTADPYAAFINNVNLVVNPVDVESLPQSLERGMRAFKELYRDFDKALGAANS